MKQIYCTLSLLYCGLAGAGQYSIPLIVQSDPAREPIITKAQIHLECYQSIEETRDGRLEGKGKEDFLLPLDKVSDRKHTGLGVFQSVAPQKNAWVGKKFAQCNDYLEVEVSLKGMKNVSSSLLLSMSSNVVLEKGIHGYLESFEVQNRLGGKLEDHQLTLSAHAGDQIYRLSFVKLNAK